MSSTEAALIRKLRLRIIPFVFVLYVIAFLNRINIGFAALTMNGDLGITSQQFGLLAGIFFFGYFLLGVPSNLALHKIGARVWMACILLVWGTLAAVTGLVHSVPQLYVARFLLGMAESGFFPGVVLYLTYWFPKKEQARAIAFFMVAQPVTSILGAPLSGLILDHVHWLGLRSWRWMLLLEGLPAIVAGIATFLFLPSKPEDAKFLSSSQKQWLSSELAPKHEGREHVVHNSATSALTSLRVWHLALIGFTHAIGSYSLVFWMPQVVRSLSNIYSNTTVGFLVTIPYLLGLISMVLVSRSSDRHLERPYHAAATVLVAGVAFLGLSTAHSPFLSITFLSLAAIGIYGYFGPFYSMPSEFLAGAAAASGIALISSVANLGGFVGPYAVGTIGRMSGNLSGGLALAGVSMLLSSVLSVLLRKRVLTSGATN